MKNKPGRLVDAMSDWILSGLWRSGEKIPSERELTEKLDVSRVILRQALEEMGKAGLIRRDGVRGTFLTADAHARLEAMARTKWDAAKARVGFAMHASWARDTVFQTLYEGLKHELAEADVALRAYFHDFIKDASLYVNDRVDILIADHGFGDAELATLDAAPVKTILALREATPPQRNFVAFDEELAGYLAGKYLFSRGHRKIACFGYVQERGEGLERSKGLKQASDEFGLELEKAMIDPAGGISNSRLATEYLLTIRSGFTAIIACDDRHALLIRDYLENQRTRVPEEMSLIGIGDDYFSAQNFLPLTTVKAPYGKMVRCLAEAIVRFADTGKLSVREKIPPYVVERATVKTI